MSIFTKDCPVCAASHPAHQVRCACGYCFDPDKTDGVTQELEAISQEEHLYRDYLFARAEQAEKDWQEARALAARDPDDIAKAARATLTKQIAATTRAELEAQDERAKAVKNRIKVVRSRRHERKAAAVSVMPPTTTPARAVPSPKPPLPMTFVSLPPVAATPMARTNPSPIARQAQPTVPQAPARPSVKEIHQASVSPPPTPALIAKPDPKPVAAPMAKPTVPQTPVSAGPSVNKFRPAPIVAPAPAAPARRAQPPPAPVTAKRSVSAPGMDTKPTSSFRAYQANKAQQITPAAPPAHASVCPNCSAKVAAQVTRCRCGFELSIAASQIPSLALDPEERAAILAVLAPPDRDPTK